MRSFENKPGTLNGQGGKKKLNLTRMALILALFIGVSLFYVWCKVEMVDHSVSLRRIHSRYVEARSVNEKLKLEREVLRSVSRIERIALEEIGLRYPAPRQIRHLNGSH